MNKFIVGFPSISKYPSRKGFTLIELLIVISMIGILSVIGGASYLQSQRTGRNARKASDLKNIQQALEAYYSATGAYPGGTCNPGVTYLPQGIPKNPQTQVAYAATSCTTTAYCFCTQLEGTTTGGNSTVTNCTNYASGSYYCVNNLQ